MGDPLVLGFVELVVEPDFFAPLPIDQNKLAIGFSKNGINGASQFQIIVKDAPFCSVDFQLFCLVPIKKLFEGNVVVVHLHFVLDEIFFNLFVHAGPGRPRLETRFAPSSLNLSSRHPKVFAPRPLRRFHHLFDHLV